MLGELFQLSHTPSHYFFCVCMFNFALMFDWVGVGFILINAQGLLQSVLRDPFWCFEVPCVVLRI